MTARQPACQLHRFAGRQPARESWSPSLLPLEHAGWIKSLDEEDSGYTRSVLLGVVAAISAGVLVKSPWPTDDSSPLRQQRPHCRPSARSTATLVRTLRSSGSPMLCRTGTGAGSGWCIRWPPPARSCGPDPCERRRTAFTHHGEHDGCRSAARSQCCRIVGSHVPHIAAPTLRSTGLTNCWAAELVRPSCAHFGLNG